MVKTLLNIKTDTEVKAEAQHVARELGVPLSTIINAYLKEFIREREVRLSLTPRMSPRLERLLEGVEQDIKRGRNLSPAFSSGSAMDTHLDSLS